MAQIRKSRNAYIIFLGKLLSKGALGKVIRMSIQLDTIKTFTMFFFFSMHKHLGFIKPSSVLLLYSTVLYLSCSCTTLFTQTVILYIICKNL
jgi:hypothetical protein